MRNLMFLLLFGIVLFTSCNKDDDGIISGSSQSKVTYEVEIASPLDLVSIDLAENDSLIVPINVKEISREGIQTKAVTEEVIPTNAVLTYRKGPVSCYFHTFWGTMLCEVWTLSVKVDYKYGQAVMGHKGPKTAYKPSGSVDSKITQSEVWTRNEDGSGSWSFSTAVYKPLSSYGGQVMPGCNVEYPFSHNEMKLYYTWIDGGN
ncbi:hypothetical protein DXA15_25195 [Parabacteroides sp. AM58-2XD]|uniref:hypothetical protein n=2 Tax=Tannerellaceae TaxID=2005525 RepID=UPI000FE1E232|nr:MULTISPECIES: hypothetical protein [Parabacteroides]MCM0717712.1 hypothetical protein [Parabacteroides sp. W1-Q-101]RGY89860.1 hypothetical protein DXA15_25195 [Parabacteroides sp. AM58-2XD]GKG70968.1 hypothetical protein CE91St1_01110 [Parabacteroides goldsteinii]GKG76919.1 hypothetical protein CE91St2_01110 [Parabacteroides goldsteinii]